MHPLRTYATSYVTAKTPLLIMPVPRERPPPSSSSSSSSSRHRAVSTTSGYVTSRARIHASTRTVPGGIIRYPDIFTLPGKPRPFHLSASRSLRPREHSWESPRSRGRNRRMRHANSIACLIPRTERRLVTFPRIGSNATILSFPPFLRIDSPARKDIS